MQKYKLIDHRIHAILSAFLEFSKIFFSSACSFQILSWKELD